MAKPKPNDGLTKQKRWYNKVRAKQLEERAERAWACPFCGDVHTCVKDRGGS